MRSPNQASADREIDRLSRRPSAALLAVACGAFAVLAPAARADPTALEQAQRISVWGVPAASDAEGAAASVDGSAARQNIVRSVSLEQSRWGESALRRASVGRPALADPSANGRAGVEVTDLSYRWGVGDSRNAMDVGLGAGAYRLRSGAESSGATAPHAGAGFDSDGRRDVIVPTFSVGMRHRLSDQHRLDVYASGSASLASPAVGEFYTAKVKVEWLPTKNSGLGFEQAAVNMRFSANSNLALRVRGGGAMVYYRSKF